MRLYTAWYPGDPVYSLYDDDAALLVSPTSVPLNWRVTDLPKLPRHLMIDSGGFRYGLVADPPTQKQVFERQLEMIESFNGDLTLVQLDHPIIDPNLTANARDRLVTRTLANAADLKRFADRAALGAHISLMGVVQGYDLDSIRFSARELKRMGYTRFGIGSLALLYNPDTIEARIRAVTEIVGHDVHVFGVTGVQIATRLRALEIGSVDSSRPAKAAMFNVIFSSCPFKRHEIRPTRGRNRRLSYIETPFICPCPACGGIANPDLLKVGKRKYVFLRTLHNYYHLKIALEQFDH